MYESRAFRKTKLLKTVLLLGTTGCTFFLAQYLSKFLESVSARSDENCGIYLAGIAIILVLQMIIGIIKKRYYSSLCSRQTNLFECSIYAYMSRKNPLANREEITIEDLEEYPCLAFAQGDYNSFYFAEEVLSTYEYKRLIRANDRATLLNLMIGINGYTLCSGIICEELNGSDYCAVKLKTDEKMTIGYISRKEAVISEIGQKYIEILAKYKEMVLE